ncbi:MAG: hybrid sensor histidine kinase/response regulator [Leptospira sp.]|nr:hybrid sensor histidine kinase/response regulator [Leptospira sp.]
MNTIDKNRRPKEPVLIVEDVEQNQVLLQGILKSIKVDSHVAENGKVALEMIQNQEYSLFIVDLMMPVMDGSTFISKLKEIQPEAVILVQTALDSSDTIINVMKHGVYDYIIKPIDNDQFIHSVKKALEYQYLKNIERYINQVENQKLRSQIEWLNYKETLRKGGKDSTEKSSIYNLKTSLSQGSGFGAMTTIVDMIKSSSSVNKDSVTIDLELMQILYENNEITKNMLKGLANVSDLLENKMNLISMLGTELTEKIPSFCEEIKPYLSNKNITMNFPKLKSNCKVLIDITKIQMVIEEIVLNAYKYSRESSNIDIFAHVNNGYLILSVKNDFRDDEYGGIPQDMEKLVTQPFFRIHPPDESVSAIEKFGLGLGLTMVENIVSKHNGLFFIHNAKDHTTQEVSNCVLTEIFIPLE